jgi:hypothetical protein
MGGAIRPSAFLTILCAIRNCENGVGGVPVPHLLSLTISWSRAVEEITTPDRERDITIMDYYMIVVLGQYIVIHGSSFTILSKLLIII